MDLCPYMENKLVYFYSAFSPSRSASDPLLQVFEVTLSGLSGFQESSRRRPVVATPGAPEGFALRVSFILVGRVIDGDFFLVKLAAGLLKGADAKRPGGWVAGRETLHHVIVNLGFGHLAFI
jgi:hypothetical protein